MIESSNTPKIELIYTPVVNYAIQQNYIPIIRKFVLEGLSDEDLHDLKIEIKGEPDFVNAWERRIDLLPHNQRIEIEVTGLKLSAKFLSELTEKLSGELILNISTNEKTIFSENYNVDILAYDQWNGIGTLPEMLAAFVTPNHPEIAKVIQIASKILEDWTENPSFDAYQSLNPDRVKKQMGAIYEAVASLGIIYCSPPPSFENEGQRIRMCDTIFSQKLGTCLDMAILYASCLEAIGLNPLLIVLNGHAFVGAWLIDDTFADSVNDDVSLLKKRIASGINEISLVEATLMNAGNTQSFDEAINAANYKLVKEEDFILFVDVKRARFSGIKPLPQRIKTSNGWEILEEEAIIAREIQKPDFIIDESNVHKTELKQLTKQKLWERKLLDLSLRNNLLNLRVSNRTIQLISVNLGEFEDALADGHEFQILTKPEKYYNPNQNSGVYQALNMSDPIIESLKYDLSHQKLRTYLSDLELKSGLTKLYRSSRMSLEENGANTLYLALGFLKWYETPQSELARYAPILLFPIEIIRKSAQKGYIIRGREEETIMNITLLEMLKQDFGITISSLEELPSDESGVDVHKIFKIIRRGIMSQPRWDLEEHAFLGIFSFSKFIMWNDIYNNADKLTNNKIVRSLVNGKLEWEIEEDELDINLDKKYYPSDIALPISADSTQLEAICAASENKSFILHGPPGTGKSQTITNIIANALYQGKKVLFVAEKMAALTVVQKRLANIGLDPFCLELHSNKSKKSNVLEQLRRTTEIIRKSSPEEFKTEAERLHSQRIELNGYVEALHQKHHFGFSLYESFTGFAELNSASDGIEFGEKFMDEFSKDKFLEFSDLVEELQSSGTLCGHPHNHPLKEISTVIYSQQNRTEARELISNYIEILKGKLNNRKQLCELLMIKAIDFNKEKTVSLDLLARTIKELPDTPETLINLENPERTLNQIIDLVNHGLKRDNYRESLLKDFAKKILDFDAESNLIQWNIASEKWFLPKLLGQNKILKSLLPLSKIGKIDKNKIVETFKTVILFQKEQDLLDANAAFLERSLGFLWNNSRPNWTIVLQICKASFRINSLLNKIFEDTSKVKEIRNNLGNLISEGNNSFINGKGKIILSYLANVEEQHKAEGNLSNLLEIDFNLEQDNSSDWTEFWKQNAENWIGNLDSLRDWISWNQIKKKVIEKGLSPVIIKYSNGELKNEEVLTSFKKSLFKHFSEYIIAKDSRLSVFNGKLFEAKIKKFKQQSKYFEDLTKAELFAKLALKIPSFTREAANSSEIGIIQKAIRNNSRGISIRRLFDMIPNLLPRMCPCMLMSPISVAQYFEVDHSKFDLVIFDEASQMPTCEAVGAIARGQNVIVVGDPKQMPPTNFFSSNHFDEENADKEDLESILDDCLALSMPSKYLKWHYRSKHESLIAFSNSNYYENKLLTFPSPDDLSTKVKNVFVPGFYDRSKTRQNSFEAKAIVSEVLKRLSDPVLSQRSIGIVTFSSVQQNLIEDLLNEAFKKQPELEQVSLDSPEPIFIKNLENVQGDERDIILFSMGYGPDQEGKIYLNFGPLNREGGWRRLNVAVSRARYEMIVFSTLRSNQIDISRTSSEGVAGIKAFLEYTEKGKIALPQKEGVNKTMPRHLEKLIAKEILKLGYKAEIGIGCSGYRMDIGIVDSDNPSEYILGILTDGETYHSAKTAKDREIVQSDFLKILGWNIYKLWSPDWWDNSSKVIKDIERAIKEAEDFKNGRVQHEIIDDSFESHQEESTSNNSQVITQEVIQPVKNYMLYNICILEQSTLNSSDEFFDPLLKFKIKYQIKQVIQTEAPISHSLLSRRILSAWGISRLGVRLNKYLSSFYSDLALKRTSQNGSFFYWTNEQIPEKYEIYRISREEDQKRSADELAKEEIVCGIKDVLMDQLSLPEEDLIREVAKVFGFARLGGNVELAMKIGIDFALKQKLIIQKDERLVLTEE